MKYKRGALGVETRSVKEKHPWSLTKFHSVVRHFASLCQISGRGIETVRHGSQKQGDCRLTTE
ncbi:MAG: hypothetical protein ACU841_07595 [Gammaproteobacteria bacterium]